MLNEILINITMWCFASIALMVALNLFTALVKEWIGIISELGNRRGKK